jgi:hypothetical protein
MDTPFTVSRRGGGSMEKVVSAKNETKPCSRHCARSIKKRFVKAIDQ